MRRYVVASFAVCLMALSLARVAYVAAPTRGYVARACGFDLNDNGVIGEAADCNICDGSGVPSSDDGGNHQVHDYDGDTVAEDLYYVNCNTGLDSATCGLPTDPCKTVRHAMTNRRDGVADGAEDAVCGFGTCSQEGQPLPFMAGLSGGHTRPLTGSLRNSAFQYSDNPSMLVGWDKDNDGRYPPFDTDDGFVIDGGPAARLRAFSIGATGVSDFEMAHMSITRFADFDSIGLAAADAAIAANSPMGAINLVTNNSNTNSDRLYFHDIEKSKILHKMARVNESRIFSAFVNEKQLNWLAIENTRCLDCGGYYIRGSGGNTAVNGPIRLHSSTMRGLPCSNNDTLCDHAVGSNSIANQTSINFAKLFGWWDDVEIVDNVIDANVSAYTPHVDSSNLGGNIDSCMRRYYYINNLVTNPRFMLQIQPTSDSCSNRALGPLYIEQNEAIWTSAASVYDSDKTGIQTLPSTNSTSILGDVVIANNSFDAQPGSGGVGQWLELRSGHSVACADHTGVMEILNNTFRGNCTRGGVGCISFGANVTTCPYRHYVAKNNLISGNTGRPNVFVSSNVTGTIDLDADYNLYSVGQGWQWGGSTISSIANWRSVSGADANSKQGTASFVSNSDTRLVPSDTQARDAGICLPASTPFDRDGTARPQGNGCDIGAHEVSGVIGCTTNGDCNDTNGCTTDTCSASNCVFTNNTASCDDGLFCTATDTCVSGACVGMGSPCSGGTPVCNETTNACEATPTTTLPPTTTTLPDSNSIADDTILLLDFEGEATGATATDDSPRANDMAQTVVGTLGDILRLAADCWHGTNCARLNGGSAVTGQSFQRASASFVGLSSGGPVSFGLALRPSGTDASRGYGVVGKRSGLSGFRLAWFLDCNTGLAGDQSCVKAQLDGVTIQSADSSVPANQWSSVWVTIQPGVTNGTQIFVSGSQSGTRATMTGVSLNSTPAYVADSDPGFDFDGDVDVVAIIPFGLDEPTLRHIAMCSPKGDECLCDPVTPASFFDCSTNADCGGSPAICSTAAGECRGHWTTGWSSSLPPCNLNSAVATPPTTTTTVPVTTSTTVTTTTVTTTTSTTLGSWTSRGSRYRGGGQGQ